jgi:hypothetical protein
MHQNPSSVVDVIGIDIGKNSFHVGSRGMVEIAVMS